MDIHFLSLEGCGVFNPASLHVAGFFRAVTFLWRGVLPAERFAIGFLAVA